MDLILCAAQDVSQSETAAAALAGALTRGQITPASFSAAVGRVTALRASVS
jgi:beta-N-acetylhexosaminidase